MRKRLWVVSLCAVLLVAAACTGGGGETNQGGKVTLKLYNVPPDASGSMTVGSAGTTVTTTVPGQNAYFTFSGTVGHRLALSMKPVTISAGSLTLKNPDGTVLAGPQAFATAPTFIGPILLSR